MSLSLSRMSALTCYQHSNKSAYQGRLTPQALSEKTVILHTSHRFLRLRSNSMATALDSFAAKARESADRCGLRRVSGPRSGPS
jgi:hypothetical protein